MGLSPERAQKQADIAFRAAASINKVDAVKKECKSAVDEKNMLVEEAEQKIGAMAVYLKKTLDESSGAPLALGIVGSVQTIDKSELIPEIRVKAIGGQVKIMFKKKHTQGVAIYTRLRGEQEWQLLSNEVSSPYWDTRPLAVPYTPEAREYRAICTQNFKHIGHYSSITFAVLG